MNKAQQKSASRIRQAVQLIEGLASLEIRGSSRKRKHDMESVYSNLLLHAGKLHLQIPTLSTYYSPEQYLRNAQDILSQLERLEAIIEPARLPSEGNGNDQPYGWRVQPEESVGIDYQAFLLFYGFTRQQIDWLITIIQHFYPKMPIQNRTVEWAVLRQRDMEGQDLLAKHYEASQNAAWHPHNASWWYDPVNVRRRTIIALYFSEWLHAAHPLTKNDTHESLLVAQLEVRLSSAAQQLWDALSLKKKTALVADAQILLLLAHTVGCFISLIHLSAGDPDAFDLVWNRLSGLGKPMDVLIAKLADYYERLAEREPPIKDDETLLTDIFFPSTH